MKPTDDLVREFHEAFELDTADHPISPSGDLVRFRLRLIREEFEEVEAELRALLGKQSPDAQRETLANLLKEMCDLRYVLDGTAVSLGLPYEDAYREVHRSNMSKLCNGCVVKDEGGKVMKGSGYTPADMARFVPPIHDAEYEEV